MKMAAGMDEDIYLQQTPHQELVGLNSASPQQGVTVPPENYAQGLRDTNLHMELTINPSYCKDGSPTSQITANEPLQVLTDNGSPDLLMNSIILKAAVSIKVDNDKLHCK